MGFEIYYTSAPEGIRSGTSGFCTVAASENIPKSLWDRLETLSAYRHNGGVNPVSLGHCILTVAGRTYHVLSRVCDAGVDHTQRTNSFAHHLVLEQREMEAAGLGPAWMLRQAGVMASGWDGRVGNLPARMLPTGADDAGSRVCRRWEQVTGDAGWGGHLAELFAKSPTKPVCILFPSAGALADGEEMVELLGEALALLPPAARWNVTFNTYFTSMPTSATCLWRCCLAGTPAAELGKRYAATGLILDLTDRARLPGVPGNGALVNAARSGQLPEQPRPASVSTRPTASKAPANTPASREKPAPRQWMNQDVVDEEIYAESGELGFADDTAGTVSSAGAAEARPPKSDWKKSGIRDTERALQAAERAVQETAERRRRQVMWLFGTALAAIGLGMGAIYVASRRLPSPPPPLTPTVSEPKPLVNPEPVSIEPQTQTPTITPQTPTALAPSETPSPVTQPPGNLFGNEPQVHFPETLAALVTLERPIVGTGIGERVQKLAIKREEVNPAAVTGLHLILPGSESGLPADDSTFTSEDAGALLTAPGKEKGTVALLWKKSSDTGAGMEVLAVAFDRSQPALEIRWHSSMLLKNAPLLGYYFWMLQSSTVELERRPAAGGAAATQQVRFKPFDAGKQNFEDAQMQVRWPVELPKGVTITSPEKGSLAEGWTASWYTDWEEKDSALRTTENASQVIKFKRPSASGGADAWFLVTFRPGIGTIESTFARRRADDAADLEKSRNTLDGIDKRIAEAKPTAEAMKQPLDPELLASRDRAAADVATRLETVMAYDALMRFDVGIELAGKPGNVRIAALHFERPGGATGK